MLRSAGGRCGLARPPRQKCEDVQPQHRAQEFHVTKKDVARFVGTCGCQACENIVVAIETLQVRQMEGQQRFKLRARVKDRAKDWRHRTEDEPLEASRAAFPSARRAVLSTVLHLRQAINITTTRTS